MAESGIGSSASLSEVQAFESAHHLSITSEGDKFAYHLRTGGKEQELFRTDANAAGLRAAERMLDELVDREEKQLTQQYGVQFASPGEDVERQRAASYETPKGPMVKARKPELFELEGVKAALGKSMPSNEGAYGGGGVKFYWLQAPTITALTSIATFQQDKDGRASVYLWPDEAKLTTATEADLTSQECAVPFTEDRKTTIEAAVVHELGHNQFAKLGFAPLHAPRGSSELTESGTEVARKLGWVRRQDEIDSDENWFIVGRSKDVDGKNATYMRGSNGLITTYTRWKQAGGAVDEHGQKVPAGEGQELNEAQMRKEALVEPPTWYFPSPEEEYAESVKLYRLGPDSRAALLKDDIGLYHLIKDNDQKEIDAKFGKRPDGTPFMVRDLDGTLIANTSEAQKRIAAFESGDFSATRCQSLGRADLSMNVE